MKYARWLRSFPFGFLLFACVAGVYVWLLVYSAPLDPSPPSSFDGYTQESGTFLAHIQPRFDSPAGLRVMHICTRPASLTREKTGFLPMGTLYTLDLWNHPRIVDRRGGATVVVSEQRLQPGQVVRIRRADAAQQLSGAGMTVSEIQIIGDSPLPTLPGCMNPSYG